MIWYRPDDTVPPLVITADCHVVALESEHVAAGASYLSIGDGKGNIAHAETAGMNKAKIKIARRFIA
jgi:hypothetical protein